MNASERLKGYRKALRTARVPIDLRLMRYAGNQDAGYWCAAELLAMPHGPTAIIVCNNLLTLGLLAALRDSRLTSPKDISIVGFDDFEWCPYLAPALSMIRVPASELGAAAARVLMKRIRLGNDSAPERIFIPTKLVVRGSTAGPPAGE